MNLAIGLIGANGRMGQEVRKLCQLNRESYRLVSLLSRQKLLDESEEKIRRTSLEKKDWIEAKVLIDFSQPVLMDSVLNLALDLGCPLVSGTTGIDTQLQQKLQEAAKKIPVLWSSNMSLGMALVRKFLMAVNDLSQFEITLTETHHIWKKDAPSGTALSLRELIENRNGNLRSVQANRLSDVVGDHELLFFSEGERIRLEHSARDRKIFAKGALVAATWIKGQKPGFYTMDNLLK